MPYDSTYHEESPTRAEIERTTGLALLEFGASWCGHCQALSSTLESLLDQHPEVQHIRVADGKGKPLGRSFQVKLWPTLVFLREGQVVDQLVRPNDAEVRRTFEQLAARSD